MAESRAVAKQALKKLEDQLTCAICLDAFKDPKLLQCFHVYCKDCLQRLVVQDRQGQLSLRCPTCRQSTLLPPATNVDAFKDPKTAPMLPCLLQGLPSETGDPRQTGILQDNILAALIEGIPLLTCM